MLWLSLWFQSISSLGDSRRKSFLLSPFPRNNSSFSLLHLPGRDISLRKRVARGGQTSLGPFRGQHSRDRGHYWGPMGRCRHWGSHGRRESRSCVHLPGSQEDHQWNIQPGKATASRLHAIRRQGRQMPSLQESWCMVHTAFSSYSLCPVRSVSEALCPRTGSTILAKLLVLGQTLPETDSQMWPWGLRGECSC